MNHRLKQHIVGLLSWYNWLQKKRDFFAKLRYFFHVIAMRFSFANSCFGIYIDLTWGLFWQVGKWVLRVMQNFIMLIFKVSAFQRHFPWEILVVPKRTEFCGVLVDFTLQLGMAWTLLWWDVTSLPLSLEESSSVEPLVTFS